MKKRIKIIIYTIVILFLLVLSLTVSSYFIIDVSHYEVDNNKIPSSFNEYKMLLLSDLHNRDITNRLVEIVNLEKPNIILMSGDMSNNDSYDNFIKLCDSLKEYDIYYVKGNHELDMSDEIYSKFIRTIEKYVNVIDNKLIKIEKDNQHINLYGLTYPLRYYSMYNSYYIEKEDIISRIGNPNTNEFNMLMTHNPLFYDSYNEWGSDLVFSGHIHGGIVRIPFIGGLLSPDFTFFPKYYQGNNKINNMNLIVSRGLGYGGELKIRINNPSEVVVVKLKAN